MAALGLEPQAIGTLKMNPVFRKDILALLRLARIAAVLRRTRASADTAPAVIAVGDLLINPRQRKASLHGEALQLTRREFDVLTYLAERVGEVVSRRELLTEVWNQTHIGEEQTIDVHISWLRRTQATVDKTPNVITVGHLEISPRQRRAVLHGETLQLTRREFDVLTYLAERVGQVVSRRELLTEVWNQSRIGEEQTIDVHISWLRRKLGETAAQPRYLHTVRGVGVMMVEPR